jgi:hypothetical protein
MDIASNVWKCQAIEVVPLSTFEIAQENKLIVILNF